MSSSRKYFFVFDWPLLLMVFILLAVGLVNLYSATATTPGTVSPFFKSQLQWAALGLVGMFLMLTFHYRRLQGLAFPLYGFTLILLLAVVFFGHSAGGQKNWLALGPIRMQPSELAKVSVLLLLAKWFSSHPYRREEGLRSLVKPLLLLALPLILILLEKDLGSAIFFVLIGFSFLFLVGVPKRLLVGGLILMMLSGAAGYRFFLSDYQKDRIQSFLHPEQDPRGKGYHLFQSKIAVGSGQGVGKGFLEGHLNKFKFLPERHTDFVFPVLAEEWGFLGSGFLLFCFGALFILLLQAASKVQDRFGSLLIAGVAAWLFWQWALNVGGVLGLLPLAGVTLPLMSYGGSALLMTFLALGVALNVHMRRYVN